MDEGGVLAHTGALKVTAVLFDLDDTLFDHRACTREALRALWRNIPALAAFEFDMLESRHAALLEAFHVEVLAGRLTVDEARRRRFARLIEEGGGGTAEADAGEAASAYREAYVRHWRPVPGALALLDAVARRARVGLVTNNVAGEQRQKIAACGFAPYLDAVVISEEAGVAKPEARIFAMAMEQLGSEPQACVMLGDAWEADILGARAAGLRAVWFNRNGAEAPDRSVPVITSLTPARDVCLVLGLE
jgi:HAD superfamily hydrolase (TIGR01509 family)